MPIGAVYLRTMDRMSISLSNPQLAYLRAEAKRLGISVGDLIRRIIDQHRTAAEFAKLKGLN